MVTNNINLEALGKYFEEVKKDPSQAKKTKRVDGEWVLEQGRPQFKAELNFEQGSEIIQSDFAPFMGGWGSRPDPIQYCLYGLASCFAGTFAAIASQEGVVLKKFKVSVENKIDLSRTLGLSENPIVEEMILTSVIESDASKDKIAEIMDLAVQRCPGVYCLTKPIPLKTNLVIE